MFRVRVKMCAPASRFLYRFHKVISGFCLVKKRGRDQVGRAVAIEFQDRNATASAMNPFFELTHYQYVGG
jgi:hypothetical protein